MIESARDRLFAELTKLREHDTTARPVETAQILLTRWWARANWKSRQQLIDAAEWLIRLQRNRGIQPLA